MVRVTSRFACMGRLSLWPVTEMGRAEESGPRRPQLFREKHQVEPRTSALPSPARRLPAPFIASLPAPLAASLRRSPLPCGRRPLPPRAETTTLTSCNRRLQREAGTQAADGNPYRSAPPASLSEALSIGFLFLKVVSELRSGAAVLLARSSVRLEVHCLVPMSKKKSKPQRPIKSLKDAEQAITSDYIGGDALDDLLSKLIRSVDVAKASRGGLPEKIWMKQQFAIGVNDVTRVLERMPAAGASHCSCSNEASTGTALRRAPLVPLQVVIVAADCNPKWLTKHIPTLATTRQVPILCLKDNKGSSLRLGQVVNMRTALAIGIKARDSMINKTIDEVLKGSEPVADEH